MPDGTDLAMLIPCGAACSAANMTVVGHTLKHSMLRAQCNAGGNCGFATKIPVTHQRVAGIEDGIVDGDG